MVKRALVGAWTTCVCVAVGAGTGAAAAPADIVLYASDATNLRGSWTRSADATGAGGQVLNDADNGWSNTTGPAISPANSVDFAFSAPAGTAYHVWVHMRAAASSKYNDSIYLQFSDAVDASGAAVYRLATTSGLVVNLATDSSGSGLGGWSWQDGAYWLVQVTTLRFASSGTHTLRIQTREDGVQIDQVLLSAAGSPASAPAAAAGDPAIAARAGSATIPAPWTARDIGATGLAGTSAFANGTFTIAGSGADIWGTADAFTFVSQPVSGNTRIVARVVSLQNTNTYAKAGVMLRESNAAGSADVLLDIRPNGGVEFMTRRSSGATTTFLAGGSQPAPGWVKLERIGSTVTAAISADGSTWTTVGSTSTTMGTAMSAGLVVTSHDTSTLNTARFDNVGVSVPAPPPSTPVSPAPAAGATGVSTSASLSWSAGGAASYDVNFGATNPPARVATGLATGSYAPGPLTAGTTYYWQVTARNASGSAAGPVWSFKTQLAPPTTPLAVAPGNGVSNVAAPTALSWTSNGATTYDVACGTTNPPPMVATAVTATSFALPALANGTTYYWQITARNAGGTATSAVAWFTTQAQSTTPPTLVFYAGDASLHGNWSSIADATAATGRALVSADRGWSNTTNASAAPADYFEVTFAAPAATPYHLWLRMKAAANSKYNDSVYAQFSDARDANGATVYPIGTTRSLVINLSTAAGDASLNGWGWQDGAYWLVQTTTVKFATAGPHTLRIQTREDGVSIDQIVLSSTTYLNTAPGPQANDSTILGKDGSPASAPTSTPPPPSPPPPSVPTPTPPPSAPKPSPAFYNAVTDRNAYAKPPVPALGPAGYTFNDPTFGSRMLRVTDGNTRPGVANRSYRVPSNAHLAAWNANSTAFYVISNDGTSVPYTFDAATMTASRMQATANGDGGMTLAFYGEPQFSMSHPNMIYGVASGGNNHTVTSYDFSAGRYSTVIDLETLVGGLSGTYVGGLLTGSPTDERLVTFFGGIAQDYHYYLLWAPLGNMSARKLVDTHASTINGAPTATMLNFNIHSASIDKSGRYVFIYPTAQDLAAPRNAAHTYVWDTQSDSIVALTNGTNGTVNTRPYGHDASGYGYSVNQDCCTGTSWDAAQWQFRNLSDPTRTSDLISPVLPVKEVYFEDHTTWNNARPDAMVPVISSTYRYGTNTVAWRAWDDEIVGIETVGGGGGMVYRFAHHRSSIGSDSDPTQPYFWYEPIANVSPDGRWVIFTSNWEKTLGRDAAEGTYRQDVFLVQLTPQ